MKTVFSAHSKRLLGICLALVMMLSVMPIGIVGFAEETTYSVGDIIEFGSYPQSEVTDAKLKSQLNNLAGSTDTWNSYGYLDAQNVPNDYMKYQDITYNGEKYRGVYFSSYCSEVSRCSQQNTNGYAALGKYWFKYEPIKWRILDASTGLVLSEILLDSQPFEEYYKCVQKFSNYPYQYFNAKGGFACVWENSSIKSWLNTEFINTAFTTTQASNINTTSSLPRIFLPSSADLSNDAYAINNCKSGSAYAKAQGLMADVTNSNNSTWTLRTPYVSDLSYNSSDTNRIYAVDAAGNLILGYTNSPYYGVCPAMYLKSFDTVEESTCEHDYLDTVTAATCLTQGYTTHTCSKCGDSYVDTYVEAKGHDIVNHEAKVATCAEVGWNAYDTCKNCDYTTYAEIPVTAHTPDVEVTENNISATCTLSGSYDVVVYCKECKAELSRQKVYVGTANHKYSITYIAPTCTTDGSITLACTECSEKTVQVLKAIEHNYVAFTFEPTCTQKGYTKNYCVNCGSEYINNEVNALGHDMQSETIKPTCTENGCDVIICERCGYNYFANEVDALGHDYKQMLTPATCTTDGSDITVCTRCDYLETNIITATGHELVNHDAKAATCTEIGWEAYETCSLCNYSTYTEIPATGHTESEWIVIKEPTCTENGEKIKVCKNCKTEIERKNISENGHKDSDSNGYCDTCGAQISNNCSHMCHKGGIAGFVWKILNLFNKLFKINQYCSCGARHW